MTNFLFSGEEPFSPNGYTPDLDLTMSSGFQDDYNVSPTTNGSPNVSNNNQNSVKKKKKSFLRIVSVMLISTSYVYFSNLWIETYLILTRETWLLDYAVLLKQALQILNKIVFGSTSILSASIILNPFVTIMLQCVIEDFNLLITSLSMLY